MKLVCVVACQRWGLQAVACTDEASNPLWGKCTQDGQLVVANAIQRANTREKLSKLRSNQEETVRRWERGEDGWRELFARACPEYQPNPEQLQGIQKQVETHKCTSSSSQRTGAGLLCQSLLFNVATAQVFCNVDPETKHTVYGLTRDNYGLRNFLKELRIRYS
jgi:hypothetical protein